MEALLQSEAQNDAYVWAAVFLAHAWIGVALGALITPVQVAVAYAAFEVVQGLVSRRMLYADSMLDGVGVVLGAVTVAGIETGGTGIPAIGATLVVAAAGAYWRSREKTP